MLAQKLSHATLPRVGQRTCLAKAPHLQSPKRQLIVKVNVSAPAPITNLRDAATVNVKSGGVEQLPSSAGVYAVFDGDNTLQYIGLARNVGAWGCPMQCSARLAAHSVRRAVAVLSIALR